MWQLQDNIEIIIIPCVTRTCRTAEVNSTATGVSEMSPIQFAYNL